MFWKFLSCSGTGLDAEQALTNNILNERRRFWLYQVGYL
jgi:hypothetical protein